MQAAADQMALALRNAQIYDQQREMAQHQAALYGVMRAVGEQLNPPAVARAAVEAIVRLVVDQANWPQVSMALPDRRAQPLGSSTRRQRRSAVAGRRAASHERRRRGAGLRHRPDPGRAARGRSTLTICSSDPATRSELAVPLRRGERVLAVLNLESDRADCFGAGGCAVGRIAGRRRGAGARQRQSVSGDARREQPAASAD